MKRKGLPGTREEIKARITAKNNRIKRYQSRINQYQQNRTFRTIKEVLQVVKQWRKKL